MSRTMQRAGSLLGKIKLAAGSENTESRAIAAWKRASGTKIGKRTRATALVRGTLIVEVSDIIWQRQLSTLRHFLLNNLAAVLGERLVTNLDFRPMPARLGPQRAETARVRKNTSGIGDPVMAMLYRQSEMRAVDSEVSEQKFA